MEATKAPEAPSIGAISTLHMLPAKTAQNNPRSIFKARGKPIFRRFISNTKAVRSISLIMVTPLFGWITSIPEISCVVGDQRYELTQFHFHHPSEEYVHGKQFDMVLHLMHKSADGKIAGVAILLKAGAVNATVGKLWKYMPQTAGDIQEIPGVEVKSRRTHSAQRRLLHLRRIADGSALHRGRHVVCAEDSNPDFSGTDQRIRETLSPRCATASATQRTRCEGKSVTQINSHIVRAQKFFPFTDAAAVVPLTISSGSTVTHFK